MVSESDVVAETVRIEGARVLATLIRTVGDVQLAEDAVQEAALAALGAWPVTGVPPAPRAWLTVTARRKAVDILRRESARSGKEHDAQLVLELSRSDVPPDSVMRDDLLRLIFICCHPVLSPPTRMSLALRTLCGLTPAQIANVLFANEEATTKRLTRARQKISAAGVPYRVPATHELADRLPAVCGVIHALYTIGHSPLGGDVAYDVNACAEALRLAELLHDLLPAEPMPTAVLSLLLLTEARQSERLGDNDDVVTLESQDRSRWDADAITRGVALLNESLLNTGQQADPYQLQAAIAAEHALASCYDETNWCEVVRLYDLLMSVAPSEAVALGRAVAVAEASGALAGLAMLDELAPNSRWHVVRGELLAREGRFQEAVQEIDASIDESVTKPEREHRESRREHFIRMIDSLGSEQRGQ